MIETYGVDMANFKYWIPGREETYTTPNPDTVKTFRNVQKVRNEVEACANVKALVERLKSASDAIRSSAGASDLLGLGSWLDDGADILETASQKVEQRYCDCKKRLNNLELSLSVDKATADFLLAYLDCHKLYYVFFHVATKYRMKVCREAIKLIASTLVLHEKVVLSAVKNAERRHGAKPVFADDEFAAGLRSMLKQLKEIKKMAEAVGSMERFENIASEKRRFSFADHIAAFESPESKAAHDRMIAEADKASDIEEEQ